MIMAFALSSAHLMAQQSGSAATRSVEWQVINNNSEFSIAIPQGYESYSANGYNIAKGVRIDKRIIVTRLINGVLLTLDFYEGNAKDIQKELISRITSSDDPYQAVRSEDFGGISLDYYRKTNDRHTWIEQLYTTKKTVYDVQSIASRENDPIVMTFLRSVQLENGGTVVLPNVPKADGKKVIGKPTEEIDEIPLVRDETPFKGKPDRGVIIVSKPRPSYSMEALGERASGEVILRILFSASGKIMQTEVVTGRPVFWKSSVDAALRIRYIPAVKDGKLVSVWKQIGYTFSTF
jgi:Tfp pilus assembly protein PilX